jgi:hypothetical protein
MGANFSLDYIKPLIYSEFLRVKTDAQRDYLKLSEVLQIKAPEEISINFYHIATLFKLDEDKDGRFTLSDLENYAAFCDSKQKDYKPHEMQSMLQGLCTLQMWQSVCTEDGQTDFEAWVGRVLYENEPVEEFSYKPGVLFVSRYTLLHLFEILNVKATHGVEFQMFFDLLQKVAEEEQLMNIEWNDLDDYVPLSVCQTFARHFIEGFVKLVDQLGVAQRTNKTN